MGVLSLFSGSSSLHSEDSFSLCICATSDRLFFVSVLEPLYLQNSRNNSDYLQGLLWGQKEAIHRKHGELT